MKRNVLRFVKLFSIVFLSIGCFIACKKTTPLTDQELATKWAEMTLFITKNTPSNSPTFSSRCLGYIGLTMYESIVNGDSTYQSLAGQLDGLDSLPKPEKTKNMTGKSRSMPHNLTS